MPQNIEIKARLRDRADVIRRIGSLNATGPTILEQSDTFYRTATDRLKLRTIRGSHSELILYARSNESGPKSSNYLLAITEEPEALDAILSKLHGIRGVVRKTRTLYLIGPTRIHLDEVQNLGDFLELEVVLNETLSTETGTRIADQLMEDLGITPDDLLDVAYIDLLELPNR